MNRQTPVTLGEGRTPLVSSRVPNLFFKLETTNPTGSYKDRFIAAELTRVIEAGQRLCVATSSGNTGSSLAAYCARYDVPCVILVNADAPSGKLIQMQAHGATLIRIADFVTSPDVTQAVFATLNQFIATSAAALVVSAFRYCPVGMAACGDIACELPQVDHVFVPVGSGGLFAAISTSLHALQPAAKVHAVQPLGCPTLWNAYRSNATEILPVQSTTRISGLSVPFDIDASLALRLVRENGGRVFAVEDEAVFEAQHDMLRTEGIYSEPAGATALAGYRQARKAGVVRDGETSVCIVTGHGFKDPASIERIAAESSGIAATPAQLLDILKQVTQ